MIIAIDGPSGTGKSTVAKGVASKLGFTFFDTGAMYRSMAWWLKSLNVDLANEAEVASHLPDFHYEICGSGSVRKYLVVGIDVTTAIRSSEIAHGASKIAIYASVRKALVQIQRNFGKTADAVFEGRDMGTVVFPNADIKIFLTADPLVRAKRRCLELQATNPEKAPSEAQILKDLCERDLQDSTRLISPLKRAEDAILMDTSDLTEEQVIDQVAALIQRKTGEW